MDLPAIKKILEHMYDSIVKIQDEAHRLEKQILKEMSLVDDVDSSSEPGFLDTEI